MNGKPFPFSTIIAAMNIAAVAYLLWMVVVIVAGISDSLGDVAEQVAGPSRFGADGIAEVMK